MDELTIIDEKDNVLGKVETAKVHKEHLLHRSVHVFLVNSKNKILCRKIPSTSPLYPGEWSTGVGAHVPFGNSYDTAAKNATKNNIGTSCSLIMIGKIRVNDNVENELSATYVGFSDKPIVLDKNKADEARFFSEKELTALLSHEQFTPHLDLSFKLYLSKKDSILNKYGG